MKTSRRWSIALPNEACDEFGEGEAYVGDAAFAKCLADLSAAPCFHVSSGDAYFQGP